MNKHENHFHLKAFAENLPTFKKSSEQFMRFKDK